MDDRNADFLAAFRSPERFELSQDRSACSFELVCEADANPRRTPDEYRRSTNFQPDGMASSGSHAVGYLDPHQMGKAEPSSRYPAPQPARRCTDVAQGTDISRFQRVGPRAFYRQNDWFRRVDVWHRSNVRHGLPACRTGSLVSTGKASLGDGGKCHRWLAKNQYALRSSGIAMACFSRDLSGNSRRRQIQGIANSALAIFSNASLRPIADNHVGTTRPTVTLRIAATLTLPPLANTLRTANPQSR